MHGGVPGSGETSRTRIEFRLDSKEPPGAAGREEPSDPGHMRLSAARYML